MIKFKKINELFLMKFYPFFTFNRKIIKNIKK